MNTKLLRQQILDLAIRGKLVKQDPNDEPASVLLERIHAEKEQLIQQGKIKKTKASATTDTPHYQNTPFDIPSSWQWVKAEDIFLLNPKNDVDDNVDVGFVPMECVKDGYSGEQSFYTKKWKDIKKGYTHFQNGDIGIAKISPCFENKKSTIFHDLPNGYGAGTTELTILRPLIVNTRFYLYIFKSAWYISEGSKNFKGNVGQQRVSKDIFTSLFLPLPPLAEQKRIVTEVEKWFALIDDLEANKQDLQGAIKQVRAKVLDLAIHGKLVPQDPNDEPAIALLRRINPHFTPSDTSHYQKPPFNIPSSWQWVRLGEIYLHNTGKALNARDKSGNLRDYITTSNLYWNRFELDVVKQMPFTDKDLERCLVKKGDLLVCEGGDVGRAAIWNYTYDICIQNHIHRLRGKLPLCNLFYYYVFFSYKLSNRISGKGTAIQGLSSKEIDNLLVPLPPLAEQKRIVARIETIFAQLDSIAENIQ